jgi:hypothetical protein
MEVLLEKAERERDEAVQERERWKMQAEEKWGMRRELEELLGVNDTQCDKQFAKGLAALRDLIKERNEARHEQSSIQCAFEDSQDKIEELEQERDEAREESERLKNFADNVHAELFEAREESLEQARLLGKGGSREARLITERDHYKQAVEEISVTIQDWLDSIVQEPSLDFIKAIKAWADKQLSNGQ